VLHWILKLNWVLIINPAFEIELGCGQQRKAFEMELGVLKMFLKKTKQSWHENLILVFKALLS